MSRVNFIKVIPFEGRLLDNLPNFDLEELIFLSPNKRKLLCSINSIANKSTTIKVSVK